VHPLSLRVVSYNVLADSYIQRAFFPRTPPEVLDPSRRHPALAAHVAAFAGDIVCLQEVEPAVLEAIGAALPGHQVHYEPKIGKPDGVATLVRAQVRRRAFVVYADGTGHVALLVVIEHQERLLGVANTHVKWGPPPGAPVGVAQAEALLDALERFEPACAGWVVCGDFNARPDSTLAGRVRARGLHDSYEGQEAFTCNANAEAKRIDFIFHSASLSAAPSPLRAITSETVLPSAEEPSDHLAIGAVLAWTPSSIAGG
jgi:mRNA deadenylase 3'-5' endonuclease subunit Ccr4